MNAPHNKGRGKAITFLRDHVAYQGDDCLPWPFSRIRGYGTVSVNGKNFKASRLMCEMAHGPAPTPDHEAAHSCGNGDDGCVNQRHLSWKTPSENQADRSTHGTARRGDWKPKLTSEQVAEILALKGIKSQDAIAAVYGCTRENIGRIHRGLNWKTVKRAPDGLAYRS